MKLVMRKWNRPASMQIFTREFSLSLSSTIQLLEKEVLNSAVGRNKGCVELPSPPGGGP